MMKPTLALCLVLGSCASIFQPGPDPVAISTSPARATVYLDGVPVGQTPLQVTVPRSSSGMVRLELEGYQSVQYRLPTKINGTVFLNIFWGWLLPVGVIVDAAAGNMSAWTLPNSVTLVPEGGQDG